MQQRTKMFFQMVALGVATVCLWLTLANPAMAATPQVMAGCSETARLGQARELQAMSNRALNQLGLRLVRPLPAHLYNAPCVHPSGAPTELRYNSHIAHSRAGATPDAPAFGALFVRHALPGPGHHESFIRIGGVVNHRGVDLQELTRRVLRQQPARGQITLWSVRHSSFEEVMLAEFSTTQGFRAGLAVVRIAADRYFYVGTTYLGGYQMPTASHLVALLGHLAPLR